MKQGERAQGMTEEVTKDRGTLRQYIHTNQIIGQMGTQLKLIGVKQDKGRRLNTVHKRRGTIKIKQGVIKTWEHQTSRWRLGWNHGDCTERPDRNSDMNGETERDWTRLQYNLGTWTSGYAEDVINAKGKEQSWKTKNKLKHRNP